MSAGARIGVDLGGTKIEAVALTVDGRELARERIAAPRDDYSETVRSVVGLAARMADLADIGRGPLGVGVPGSPSPADGRMRNANSVWLNGRPLETDLAAAWGAPVRIANDANCFAISEATDGAGAGAKSVFGVIIGTGVGGGLVVDGRLIGGANGIGGEWGHAPLPGPDPEEVDGPRCWCGRRGCVETWCSGPGLAADHRRATGERLTAREIAALAATGDAAAAATLERYAERLGRSLAMVANIFDPEAFVLGGGLSNLPGIADRARRAMVPHVFSDSVATRIVLNRHGDSSGVRGAARLWPTEGE